MDDIQLPPLPAEYMRPGKLRQEYYTDDVLRLAAVPAEGIAGRPTPVRPDPFPPRFGYDHEPPTISDVISTDRWGGQIRSWRTGFPVDDRTATGGAYEGSLRNSLEARS